MLESAAQRTRVVDHATGYPDLVLVEDNPHDVELIRLALAEVSIGANVHVAESAAEAFAVLGRLGSMPAAVVLDLNLPVVGGAEILARIRHGSRWPDVPIIILTSSQAERDVEECIKLGATAYKGKPALFEGYVAFAQSLARYLVPR